MKCPNDDATLVMSERSGVEIDYCPECRGVWLDRGELDKILDRAATEAATSSDRTTARPVADTRFDDRREFDRRDGDRRDSDRRDSGYRDSGQYPRKRKESWLSDLLG